MSAKVLIKTSDLSRADWLRYRTMGIGGSDVSVIAEINPYSSVYQLWLEKTGQTEPAESDNEYTHFGTMLEPVVRKEFTARTGLKVRQKHMLLQSEEHQFMLANLDGVINLNGEMCIFEAKTASAYKLDNWQSGIPPEYMLQVQHYMAVTGAAKTYIAALIGGNHFEYRPIERDDEMIKKIIAMEKLFWEVNVLGGIVPEIDGTKATTEFFNSKYSFSNGQTVELPEEIVPDCEEYSRLSDEISKLTAAKDARADMKILDETFGCLGWKRTHQSIDGNLYCTVEIWDSEKKEWISKQDVGTVSYTEKEKGQASDSFKRACVSVSIGRELYSAPFVWVSAQKCSIQKKGDKLICYDKFLVSDISYNKDREIIALSVLNCNSGEVVYSMFPKQINQANSNYNELNAQLNRTGVMLDTVLSRYGVQSIDEMTPELLNKAINSLKRTKTKSA